MQYVLFVKFPSIRSIREIPPVMPSSRVFVLSAVRIPPWTCTPWMCTTSSPFLPGGAVGFSPGV